MLLQFPPPAGSRHSWALPAVLLICSVFAAAAHAQTSPSVMENAVQAESPLALRLTEFFQMPVGDKGLVVSEGIRQAQGMRVRLVGYVVQQEVATLGQFFLTPRPVLMSQHADGEADDLPPATVFVRLAPDQHDWAVAHARGLVEVTGTFDVGRKEESDGRVSWFRLQLAPDAVRAMNRLEVTQYLHSLHHSH
jgi:hypothetical protein